MLPVIMIRLPEQEPQAIAADRPPDGPQKTESGPGPIDGPTPPRRIQETRDSEVRPVFDELPRCRGRIRCPIKVSIFLATLVFVWCGGFNSSWLSHVRRDDLRDVRPDDHTRADAIEAVV